MRDEEGLHDKIRRLQAAAFGGEKLVALTAYDYPTGRLLDEAGVDILLVGDSLGMVVLGHEDTTRVGLSEMAHHTRAVRRGVKAALLAADLPFYTYETPEVALENAMRLEGAGGDMVKLEGGREMEFQISTIVAAGIPVMAHIGMLPQRVRVEGGYKKKGKRAKEAASLMDDALAVEEAGASFIVLEGIVAEVAAEITARAKVPTIGIGSGDSCHGQIRVTHDVTGGFPWFRPPFAKAYADVAGETVRAVREFAAEVRREGGGEMGEG